MDMPPRNTYSAPVTALISSDASILPPLLFGLCGPYFSCNDASVTYLASFQFDHVCGQYEIGLCIPIILFLMF